MGAFHRLSVVVLACAIAAAAMASPAGATTTLTFRNDLTPVQTHYGGANAVYMGYSNMPEANAKGMSSTLRSIEYQRAADIGVKVARTWYRQDWALPSYPSTAGGYQWSSTKMTAFKSWLSAMQSRNIDVALTMGWWFPVDICGADNFDDAGVTKCTPTSTDESTYAHWVSDSLNELINVEGYTNIKYVVLFTESNDHHGDGSYPSGYTQASYYVHIADLIASQIVSDDASRSPDIRPQIKIVGPQELIGFNGYDNVFTRYVHDHAASGTIDIYSTHDYCAVVPGTSGYCPSYATWLSNFGDFVGDVAPAPLWVDEFGVNDADRSVYRTTPAYGTWIAGVTAAVANAGASSSFVWQLQDQWFTSPNASLFQYWGLGRWPGDSTDVYPSWYAYALMGQLLGGRSSSSASSWVYQTTGGTSTIHGLATGMGPGVSPCALSGGCGSMMVVNESSTPQPVQVAFGTTLSATTFYRYVYNSGNTPRPTPDKAAYVPRWDKQFTGVTTSLPADTIPANSVVIYSTVDLGGPTAGNVAFSASATASSTESGYSADNVRDGDATQSAGAAMSWTPQSGSSGSQYVELDWSSSQTFNRVELDFTASSVPPSYALQYWDGSAWTTLATVSNNDQAHRTHTFSAVTTTKLRVAEAGPSYQPINEIGVHHDSGTRDTALGLTAVADNVDTGVTNKYAYEKFSTAGRTFQTGDTIEYDVTLVDNLASVGGLDVTIDSNACNGSNALRNAPSGWVDQNSTTGHPAGDITASAYPLTWHRVLSVPACAVGHTSTGWMLVSEDDGGSRKTTAFYDNIVVKHGGSTVLQVYDNGAPETTESVLRSHEDDVSLFVAPVSP